MDSTHLQVVARTYAATVLQEAVADWWVTLLRENYGGRPADFQEFAVRLEKRFGSLTRVDRARAALRDIRQGQAEDVRAFPLVLKDCWASSLHGIKIGQKPSLFGDCIHELRNW